MKRNIKIISFSLALLLAFTGLPTNISNASESGEILRELGILKGDLDGDLLLDQPLKRQDAVVLLSRLLGEEETAEIYPGSPSFTDIGDPYYIPFIAWAEDSGLTEGVGGGLFGYDQFLTNQQLMAFLLRALGYDFYGEAYGSVPEKALEFELSPAGEQWGEVTTRQIMADRTVTLLRHGRVKYSNVTLERSLAMTDTGLPDNGQLFQLSEFKFNKGNVIATFKASDKQDYNSNRGNHSSSIIDDGPDIDDMKVTLIIDEVSAFVLELKKQFYDSTTGVMLASFESPDIPDDSSVEIQVSYLEDRKLVAHEAAHVVQQKSPGTYEPGELLLLLEDLLGDLLQTGTGTVTGGDLNDVDMNQVTGLQSNPYFADNSLSGTMVLNENGAGNISGGSNVITLLDSVSEFVPENFFTIILKDGEIIDCPDCTSISIDGKTITADINDIQIPKTGTVEILHAYANTENLEEKYSKKGYDQYGLTKEESRAIIGELIVNLHKASKPGTLTSTYNFGLLTIHKERFDFNESELMTLNGVIVGTERTNPEIDGGIIVLVPGRAGAYELRTYSVIDHANSFRNDEDAASYFSWYPDNDGDGFGEVVYTKDKKPVRIHKYKDAASPHIAFALAPDGGLGENVTLYMKNGKVMFWTNDCDDSDPDRPPTTTYIDAVEMDIDKRSARTGRNPQTGKEIKIAAETVIIIDHEDGSVTTSTIENPDSLLETKSSFSYAKIVADGNNNALLIHIVEDAVVAYVQIKELDKSSPKVVYANTDGLSEEDLDFLLSDEHGIEKFVYRQEFGPYDGSSVRLHEDGKFAEFVDYTTEANAPANKVKFKAGAELSKTANAADDGEDNDCDLVQVGSAPDMDGRVDFGEIDGALAVLVVDPSFEIFSEISTEFRGHVTVLK